MTSALPFDDFRDLMRSLPRGDAAMGSRVRAIFDGVGMPGSSLGRMEDIAAWLSEWSGRVPSVLTRPLMAIFAGNHGVARHGVSKSRMDATAQMVELCAAGGAAINQLCLANDLGLKVFDLALDLPAGDITQEAALDERACAATMAFGMEAVAGGTDLLCLGDLGVANSTAAAAIFCMLYGGTGKDWVGSATDQTSSKRIEAVDRAVALHGAHRDDPFEVLRRVGGREFAAIAGAIIAARAEKVPVILDGHVAIAAACVLHAVNPDILGHCMLAAVPAGKGAAIAAAKLGLVPLLDFGLSYGEGVNAALAAGVVKAAALLCSGISAAQAR